MKSISLILVLFVFAVNTIAQPLDTTKHAVKSKFTPPTKIYIPATIAADARYVHLVNNITVNYNDLFSKDLYPMGLGDEHMRFAPESMELKCNEIQLPNPFGKSVYPLSYSVLYKNHLVTLFEPGYFMCLQLPSLQRDKAFEKELNTQQFQYHWLVDDKLIAISDGICYQYKNSAWVEYTPFFPLTNSPKLFDDEKYICYGTCQGEFGGYVYFYNKQTGETYFTNATCAASVYKKDGKYYVLSSLGHGMGSAYLTEIADPEKLQLKKNLPPKYKPDSTVKKIFDLYGLQLFANVQLSQQQYYITHWQQMTFLATIDGKNITIVDPLLDKEIYMHNVVTSKANDVNLVTYSFYGESGEREAGAIIMHGKNFTRIKWK